MFISYPEVIVAVASTVPHRENRVASPEHAQASRRYVEENEGHAGHDSEVEG
jgi:hypothetical protein